MLVSSVEGEIEGKGTQLTSRPDSTRSQNKLTRREELIAFKMAMVVLNKKLDQQAVNQSTSPM